MLSRAEITAYAEEQVRAEEAADRSPEWWAWLRRRWAVRPSDRTPHLADMCRAYEEATGTCIGCD
jgi:hypothetical protein